MAGEMAEAAEPAAEKTGHRWKTGRPRQSGSAAGGGAVYGIGMIGAMAYFFETAESGRDYLLAIPKASMWPALLVYKLLKSFYG